MNLISVIKFYLSKQDTNSGAKELHSCTVYNNKQRRIIHVVNTLHQSWILLMTLLLRTHNTLLVAMVIIQERLLWRCVVQKISLPCSYLALFCWWIGQATFFQQVQTFVSSSVQDKDCIVHLSVIKSEC
jgi:hypothetical protein